MSSNSNKTTSSKTSLMKQTKADLVNIILRKDDVEKSNSEEIVKLKAENKNLKEKVESLKEAIRNSDKEINNLNRDNNELKDTIDEDTSKVCELQSSLRSWKTLAIMSLIITLGLLVVTITL